MSKEFDVKDLGTPKQVLQAVIEQGKNSISVSQERAITDALKKFGMENCNPASTVLPASAYKLTKGSGIPPTQYAAKVGRSKLLPPVGVALHIGELCCSI